MEKEQGLHYRLEDCPSPGKTLLLALQWALFMYSINLVYPLVIGDIFQLPPVEITALVQRSTFLVGLGSLIQVLWGHRVPLTEGVAALWFSLFLLCYQAGGAAGQDPREVLQIMEFALLLGGLFMILLSLGGVLNAIEKLFTPLVIGMALVLIALQVSGAFVQGMLGYENGQASGRTALCSLLVLSLVTYLSYRGRALLKNFSALIGLVVGWGLYSLLGLGGPEVLPAETQRWLYLPEVLAWGPPRASAAMAVAVMVASLVQVANQVASYAAARVALGQELPPGILKRGGVCNGLANLLSGLFAGIGTVPLANAAGFVEMTGVGSRRPFLVASVILMVVGLLWPLGQFFTSIPAPVVYAVSFVPFTRMVGIGFANLLRVSFNQRHLTIIGLTLCAGVGLMFVPPGAYGGLPVALQLVCSNGLLMGIALVLLLEHVVFRAGRE